ncbi:hypothetical protein RFI_12761 [Reticulomyxa filosa]|uniref:EF-hand domain-containing protein n=1 Tax=Reticulomyxa filosa TaxID=46433 RepID=X6NEM3_RETFI|nr:hypothetical protein RFI_12761 [Reticulomyxa filosa]|eukprot:ETO24396.1 hypothetical protein RFI_12761 [Reticulomyxa filosa]
MTQDHDICSSSKRVVQTFKVTLNHYIYIFVYPFSICLLFKICMIVSNICIVYCIYIKHKVENASQISKIMITVISHGKSELKFAIKWLILYFSEELQASSSKPKAKSKQTDTKPSISVVSAKEDVDEPSFRETIEQAFWAFTGYSDYKRTNMYLRKFEVSKFLELCNITEPSPDIIFREMDSEIVDNQISFSEFVSYFCDPNVNPKCQNLQKYMEEQVNFQILRKALKIFEMCNCLNRNSTTTSIQPSSGNSKQPPNAQNDSEFTGRITFGQFQTYAKDSLLLSVEQTKQVWHEMDSDNSGDIRIVEVFEWLQKKILERSD